jgi:3-oxoacyl-[acyl-carrier protein] reductase
LKRVALVTGGSRGIGAAVAKQLAADGFDVAVQYYAAEEQAEAVASVCRSYGARALTAQTDARSGESLRSLKELLDRECWSPGVVVHCAGMAHYGLLEDTDEHVWDDLMQLHLKSAYHLTKLFAPAMIGNRWGRFVHLSSLWGVVGAAGEAAYAASKGGLNAFVKSMAKELGSAGVTVNAIAPGAIDTDMLSALTEQEKESLCETIPLGRLGRAEEVASLVRFLGSDSADYVTGQVIGLNGGWQT